MKADLLRGGLRRATQLAVATVAIASSGAVGGCLSRPLKTADTRTTSTVVARLTESAVDKIDLLLMIDNSRSMADKQQILAAAVPDLVKGLVNPKCVDPEVPEDSTKWIVPNSPTEMCPAPLKRDFNPVLDIHIAIITSSIGGHGSDSCPNVETFSCAGGATNSTNNDAGHLVTRTDPCTSGNVPTYDNGKGFLSWDPNGKQKPAGEASIGDLDIDPTSLAVTTTTPGLVPSLKDLVLGTGQIGCGYEAQIESWYRFLIDPDPYQTIVVENGRATPKDIDQVLLTQRADFLRPSSLLAIIGLTDENDCSIKEYGQFYFAAQQRDPTNPNKNFYLPKARGECATNPNDPCCISCGQNQAGCPADAGCQAGSTLDAKTDDVNLRCFDQKRRFGIDFLYPIDRYVTGLTQNLVPNRAGEMVPNPIFSDLNPSDEDSNIRDSGLVFLAYIVGVPWQDIARQNEKGEPDLLGGLDANGKPVGGFKSAAELSKPDDANHTVWDYVIGDPVNFVPPIDPHMIESTSARMGMNPFTGDAIAPTTAAAGTNKINGHEYTPNTDMGVQKWPDDLQYACIFDLPVPRNCADDSLVACDCHDPKNDNPLCEPNPNDGGNRTLQVRAKAYPGIRELSLIKAIGTQGIVGSICPKQLTNLDAPDFGYRPAIGAIIDRLKLALGGQCLPRKLNPNNEGQVQCLILEGRNTAGAHKADCDAFCDSLPARQHVQPEHVPAVNADNVKQAAEQAKLDCFCEIKQLNNGPLDKNGEDTDPSDDLLSACQEQVADPPVFNGKTVDGWCYVDSTTTPPVGNPELVKNCPATERRLVRFAGNGNPQPGATLFITCAGD